MPAAQVLDSYALLKLLRDESGAETVAEILERAGPARPAGSHDRSELC